MRIESRDHEEDLVFVVKHAAAPASVLECWLSFHATSLSCPSALAISHSTIPRTISIFIEDRSRVFVLPWPCLIRRSQWPTTVCTGQTDRPQISLRYSQRVLSV